MSKQTFSFGELLSQSWGCLRGSRLKAIGVLLIMIAINVAVQGLSGLFGFLLWPMQIGIALFFLRLARRQPAPVESLFEPFSQYGHMLWGVARPYFFVILWGLLTLPPLLAALVLATVKPEGAWAAPTCLALMLATMPLAIPAIVAGYRYALTPYVILDDPALSVKDAMRRSGDLIYGYKWRFFGYGLLLTVLVVPLTILTLGFAAFWLLPLACSFGANFYLAVKRAKEPEAIAETPAEAAPGAETKPETAE